MSETPLVCERCGQQHPCHPDSAKTGGVRLLMDAGDRLCMVCSSVFADAEAGARTLPEWLTDATRGAQTELTAYR